MRTRAKIFHHLDEIRVLRNRISHHEPVWDRDMPAAHAKVIEAIEWMNLGLAGALRSEAQVDAISAAGPKSFLTLVSRHVALPVDNEATQSRIPYVRPNDDE